ncbi:hypothetical protein GCM10025868_25410 [Angustibacter aerolatus]|uniref:GGDEF domain-containing protein n=1 Tax=Angustibacter aerolatus TaxID=1162965 RepID=A0ABQ6JKH0_9ACTN|nr:diguanylate cyclase [Angustibacter aerolatus]GMA87291.1 hypothetical protein GCM10025868_25410 [Angustibacter aerolatus]
MNDRFGHLAGDAVLRAIGTACRTATRPGDVACRYGGEEILLLLPDTGQAAAVAATERLRATVAGTPFPEVPGGRGLRVTASIGVRWWQERPVGDGLQSLVAEADAALYAAKAGGRDRVVVHPVTVALPAG